MGRGGVGGAGRRRAPPPPVQRRARRGAAISKRVVPTPGLFGRHRVRAMSKAVIFFTVSPKRYTIGAENRIRI